MANWVDDIGSNLFVSQPSYDGSNLSTATPPLVLQDMVGRLRPQMDTTGGGRRVLQAVQVHSSSAAVAAADALYWKDAAHTVVTNDQSASLTGSINDAAGVGLDAIAAGNYGFIIREGLITLNLQAAVSAGVGDVLIGSTTDKLVNVVAANTAPTNKPFGIATAAGSGAGGTVAAYVNTLGGW